VKILAGVLQPDAGRIVLDGRDLSVRSAADAAALGFGVVHQELNLLDNLDVAGNLFLGREPARFAWAGPLRWIDSAAMVRQSRPHLDRLGLNISPRTPLAQLSLAQQQMVEIAKALSQNARILVLDEPTSSLTRAETYRLLLTLKDLSRQGVSVLFISHRLGEICEIANRVVALRDGKNAGELPHDRIDHANMVRLMIGRDLRSFYVPASSTARRIRLQVRGLRTTAWPDQAVSFDAAGGEILGLAGLVGCGRSELARAIFGVDPMPAGQIALDGRPLRIGSARDAIDAGVYLVPEDRRRTGLIVDMTVRQNISLPALRRFASMLLIRPDRETRHADQQVRMLQIKTPSCETPAMNLSGGNQQKVVLAKWLGMKPKVLIVDEPTRGIDVGAKAEIYRLLRALADQDVAVIVISSDLEEVLGVSDRVAVMREGKIVGILPRSEFSERAVMDLAFGTASATAASGGGDRS
jgi:ribose transport system ATP-binding protein